jgi:hypothetical protein
MSSENHRYIAERRLLVSRKGSREQSEVVIKISAPFLVRQDDVDFPVDGTTSGCHVEIHGLDVSPFDVYGMDSLQAVSIASNIESLVKRLSDEFDFFWTTGEPYFEE